MEVPELPANFAPFIALGINVAKALIFLVAGWILAGWLSRKIRERAEKAKRFDRTLSFFAASIVRYLLLAVVAVIVLQTFGIQVTSLVAIIGAATLAIGLALQGTLSHLAAGIMLLLFRPYKVGDFVEIGGDSGTVTDLNLYMSELTTPDGVKIFVPNGEAWGKPITNYSANPRRRCDIRFGIDYGDDVDKAIGIILDVVKADARFINEPDPPWVQVVELGSSSVDIELRAWCKAGDMWEAKCATMKAVKEAFDRNGISIPYPHTTLVTKSDGMARSIALAAPADEQRPRPAKAN